jgi:DNA repair ATPase RecN
MHPIDVTIKDFQSIKELNIEIKGFSVITGKSNIGKSAIIRSIYSSLVNGPVGGLVNKDSTFTSVTMTSKEWGFKWEKGGGINRYTIGFDKYDKVGAGQFELIRNIGFGSVRLGDREVYPWYASQFKPLFLLDETGPSLSDFISDVSRLNVLQEAITINVRTKKKYIDLSRIKTDEIENDNKLLLSLIGLDDLIELEVDIDHQIQSIHELENKILNMENYYRDLEYNASKIRKLSDVSSISIEADLDQQFLDFKNLSSIWYSLDTAAKSVIAVKNISVINIPNMSNAIVDEINILKELDHYDSLSSSIQKLSDKIDLPNVVDFDLEHYKDVCSLSETMNLCINNINEYENELKSIHVNLQKIQNELSSISICPTCKQPVSDNHVIHEVQV